jgi:hypothetical protein
VGLAKGGHNVRGHGFQPVFFINNASELRDGAGRGRWEGVGRAACFTVEAILGFGVSRSTSPLFDAKVVDKCH